MASATAGSRSRRPSRSTACARAGLVVGQTLELLRSAVRAGITTGELDAIAEDHIRSPGATPSFQGYHGVPGDDLRVGQRRGRPRHPRRPGAGRRRRDLDRLRRDRRRLARRRGDHGGRRRRTGRAHRADARSTEEALWRGIAAARLGGRVTDISHAVETYVRVAGQLRHRRGLRRPRHRLRDAPAARTSPTSAGPAAAPSWSSGLALAVEPMVTLGRKQTRRPRRRLDGRDHATAAGRRTSSTRSR